MKIIVTKNIARSKIKPHINAESSITICHVFVQYKGMPARIPTKIIREPPFPIPFSVINSDIHITRTEPAVSVSTDEIQNMTGFKPGTIALLT